MRGRVRLEFGMGLSRREIWVSDAQEQAMNVLRGKRPLTEKLAFDVLRKEGEKQPAKQ